MKQPLYQKNFRFTKKTISEIEYLKKHYIDTCEPEYKSMFERIMSDTLVVELAIKMMYEDVKLSIESENKK